HCPRHVLIPRIRHHYVPLLQPQRQHRAREPRPAQPPLAPPAAASYPSFHVAPAAPRPPPRTRRTSSCVLRDRPPQFPLVRPAATVLSISRRPSSFHRFRSEERRVGKECISGWATC